MKIVRVATNNNFNCTDPEWKQLDAFSRQYLEDTFFINCNINTPKLLTINDHTYKVVVTANPDIIGTTADAVRIMLKILTIKDHIAFVRLKYVPGNCAFFIGLLLIVLEIPVVITLQRFNSLKSLAQYTDQKFYRYSCGRFRLAGKALKDITQTVKHLQKKYPVWICDQAGTGCQGCGLCSKLVTGKTSNKIYSLNLSSSGICPYKCPDCYAKTMQNFCRKMGYTPIIYDVIKQNEKQAGRTAHIKEALKHARHSRQQRPGRIAR